MWGGVEAPELGHHHAPAQHHAHASAAGHGPMAALPAAYGAVLDNVNRALTRLSFGDMLRQLPAAVVSEK